MAQEPGIRFSGGTWNINTLMIIVVGVVSLAAGYVLYGYRLNELQSDFQTFKAAYATLDKFTSLQQDEARDVANLAASITSVNTRLDTLMTTINSLDRSAAQQSAEIKNLQDGVTELRRQGRLGNYAPTIPPEFRRDNSSSDQAK
jgi:uncharacterized protein HemX